MPVRPFEQLAEGILGKNLLELIILAEYAVADVTTLDANVFYYVGLRHATRPYSTLLVYAEGVAQLPFDVAPLRAIPYRLTPGGTPDNPETAQRLIGLQLREARNQSADSPIFQLVEGFPDIQHLKTDVFRDRVRYAAGVKERLATARRQGLEAVRAIEQDLGSIEDHESAVVIDLFLSYRAVKAWPAMIELAGRMPASLAATVMVREQLALALNRAGRGEEAERVLLDLIARRGPSSETYGILGRVYKDRWEAAAGAGETVRARGLLDQAIRAYLSGFETDWRDSYPGVNAVTLMELREPPDPRRKGLIPVVAYAVERRVAAGQPDYWDHATLLELAILAGDQKKADEALAAASAKVREVWEPETTLRNLKLIREARERRGKAQPWLTGIEGELAKQAEGQPR
jgi:hypothetical protein